jgi:hypothetical protein
MGVIDPRNTRLPGRIFRPFLLRPAEILRWLAAPHSVTFLYHGLRLPKQHVRSVAKLTVLLNRLLCFLSYRPGVLASCPRDWCIASLRLAMASPLSLPERRTRKMETVGAAVLRWSGVSWQSPRSRASITDTNAPPDRPRSRPAAPRSSVLTGLSCVDTVIWPYTGAGRLKVPARTSSQPIRALRPRGSAFDQDT